MRPQFHFSPQSGWINDPNGAIRVDGVYHLFYQANPDGIVHGPMHWGHATSTDLANWTEHPIALYPEASGQCFSGSAVLAGDGKVAPEFGAADGVLLFYTAHRDGKPSIEDQAVAVADRGMTSFTKFAGNPVLPTPGPLDFRDPKVIWHAATQRWIMVVTHGQSIGFYSSQDALSWQFESEFAEGRHDPAPVNPGPWECPDLFPMVVQGTGETAWILVVGLGRGHISGGSGTQYFVGDFDGHTFRNRNPADLELFMDWGRDYYAAQTFSGMAGEDPLAIAWMSNWMYANHTPQTEFRGSMNLPRRLQLADGPEGLRLVQRVDESAAAHFPDLSGTVPDSAVYRLRHSWNGAEGARLALSLFDEADPVLVVERKGGNAYEVTFLRKGHPGIDAAKGYSARFSFDVVIEGAFDLDVFVDNGLVEIGCAGGRHWVSNLYFPADPAGAVTISG
jgi:fructan beta-fructosidase